MNRFVRMLVVVVVAALPALVAGPAGATSCAADPGATPQNLLAGRAFHDKTLFERYDVAVVATVSAIRTNEAQGGATRTTVDVHSAFNVAELERTIDVSSDDPGWMNGYAFQHGATYFIPLDHPGPQGQPHYSFVCDPIIELPGPDAAADLNAVAADNGVIVAQLVAAQAPPPAAPGLSIAGLALIAVLAVLALVAVGGVAAMAGRRRGRVGERR